MLLNRPKPQDYYLFLYAVNTKNESAKSSLIASLVRVEDRNFSATASKLRNLNEEKQSNLPNKIYEFMETDFSSSEQVVLNLGKKYGNETYSIKNENRWISVEPAGTVKVKEPWDYEQLGAEKIIEFDVIVNKSGVEGEFKAYSYFAQRSKDCIVPLNASPGTVVYKLEAQDPDTDSKLRFLLTKDKADGRFEVDSKTGEIKTKGNEPFVQDKEYVIHVVAEDQNGPQLTKEEKVSIIGGRRPPQFFMTRYNAYVYANNTKDSDVIEVKAKSFNGREIKYTLKANEDSYDGLFNMDSAFGTISLARNLSNDDVKNYSLTVKALEQPDGYSSAVDLSILVKPIEKENNTADTPKYVANIDEDIPIGTPILQVPISGNGSDLFYSVDRSEFTIDKDGVIFSTKRLDADIINNYEMAIRATKVNERHQSMHPAKTTMIVNVFTANKNDEAPKYSRVIYETSVDENVRPNTVITRVDAADKDGDNVLFSFENGLLQLEMFKIEERTGDIRIIDAPFRFEKDQYELIVLARDDGSCCRSGSQTLHTSTASVIVSIVDVNDNKPVFENCDQYFAHVHEGAPRGTFVVAVKAFDNDRGLNSELFYSIAYQPNQRVKKFIIDPLTGIVRTNKVFDREGEGGKFEMVTVIATDKGSPPLEGICTFKVHIVDTNDNSPLFDRLEYKVRIKQDSTIGSNVVKISATDEDSNENGDITYSLQPIDSATDLDFFQIEPKTGWITVNKILNKPNYHLKAIASDEGTPKRESSVEIEIDVYNHGNNPPAWTHQSYGPITIKENFDVGKLVVTMKAYSGIPDNHVVYYNITNGNSNTEGKEETFFLSHRVLNGETLADLHLRSPLDYEKTKSYNLTIRATNNGATQLYSDTMVQINVEDVNDEIPFFDLPETIVALEGMPPGTLITKLRAIDLDGSFPNNKVLYSIDDSENAFTVDRETGELFTKIEFDRETRAFYPLLIRAFDGAPSALFNRHLGLQLRPNSITKFVRVEIGDKNDNAPYFDKSVYEGQVFENEDLMYKVFSITARDKDESSVLTYSISKGNTNDVFGIRESNGEIYVAGNIDYETKREYKLKVVASDGVHENFTTVLIFVKDINDNPPLFEKSLYQVQITEENDLALPQRILQVKAIDGDQDRKTSMVYFLRGYGINEEDPMLNKFSINSSSGEIYVLQPLDRDLPSGRSEWRFTVFADDENGSGLLGYSEVVVKLKDINDNAPFFPNSISVGSVRENSTAGMFAVGMHAIDYDDPDEEKNAKLKYRIENNPVNALLQPIFNIDEDTGIITTAVCCLDREKNPEYRMKVIVMDGGGLEGTGTAIIKIKDVNDMSPTFTKREWHLEVDETFKDELPLLPILTLSVEDGDLLETNKLSYKVLNNSFGADKFGVITNSDGTGSLIVIQPLDYEDPRQRYGFNLSITVSDEEVFVDSYHIDMVKVYIKLRDINDNEPVFDQPIIEIEVAEDIPLNSILAELRATDADENGNSQIHYSVDRSSDKNRQFTVDENGFLRLQQSLDRETQSRHEVKILAIDEGEIQLTSTAVIKILVGDVNDNAPVFAVDYSPVVYENSSPQKVEEIQAVDVDDPIKGNGPPFTFRMDPNAPEIIKALFDVQSSDTGNGIGVVRAKNTFDREIQKEYYIPIIISDSGFPPMSATNTLTVIIGDRNDNRMRAGSKRILVYSFKGESLTTPIGRVYVNDADDWDLNDKTFFWQSNQHPNFELKRDTGEITMKSPIEGEYFLKFNVYDRKFALEVTANVNVTVKLLPEEAVQNSASIRVSGITAEDFVKTYNWNTRKSQTSKYEKLRNMLSRILKVTEDNVHIFSITTKQLKPPTIDIRFSVKGSNYFQPLFVDGTVSLNRDIIVSEVGINITMIGIDECLIEGLHCDGSCTSSVEFNRQSIVVNANETAFVGLNVWSQPKCVCTARDFTEAEICRTRPCLNGGRCSDTRSGIVCKCPKNYDGPQCEALSRTFINGQGWAWFPSLQTCEKSHLSLEILTQIPNGLIFFNGPLVRPDPGTAVVSDFISLELLNGQPRLLIDFGSGTTELIVNTRKQLSDGNWHRLDIYWNTQTVRLVVDHCDGMAIDQNRNIDKSRCENRTQIPLFNEYLNLNTPLQLGGMVVVLKNDLYLDLSFKWKYTPTKIGFTGCIKNLVHNGYIYDLGSPGISTNSNTGCNPAQESCQNHLSKQKCVHGTCLGSYNSAQCICNNGWYGNECDKEAESKFFQEKSFLKFNLFFSPDFYKTEIQLMFRTRQKSGELFRLTSRGGHAFCVLEIRNRKLRFRFNNLGSKRQRELVLENVIVNDGEWHTVNVARYGATAFLSLDGGGGRRYEEIVDEGISNELIVVDSQNVLIGGNVHHESSRAIFVDNDFSEGCIKDIRLNQRYLSLTSGSNAMIVERRNLLDGCPSNNPCNGIVCTPPFVCIDKWMLHECV
ncbi:Pt1-cadherin-like protein [Dinothrombium tinctorium]|uniref:Pt1-cadherin-like protein n=1 Tax=Dinothrombium tinctorium TaxID=1965070 RepID=A0A3S4QQ04_9ACAR|nr:Pt1-cadherin-like protein [Dinothrombium tinctorium]